MNFDLEVYCGQKPFIVLDSVAFAFGAPYDLIKRIFVCYCYYFVI